MHKKNLIFNILGLSAVPEFFHEPVAETPEFAVIFGKVLFHTVVYPVDTYTETAAFIEVYHQFSVFVGNLPVGKERIRVDRHDVFADRHKTAFEDVAVRRIIDMEHRFSVVRRKFHGDRNALLDRVYRREFLYYPLRVFRDDLDKKRRNIFEMVVKGVSVDTAAFDNILDGYLGKRFVVKKFYK